MHESNVRRAKTCQDLDREVQIVQNGSKVEASAHHDASTSGGIEQKRTKGEKNAINSTCKLHTFIKMQ